MVGKILKFFKRKDYGFIKADTTYFFNTRDCNDYEGYNIGDVVEFEIKGERAINVKKSSSMLVADNIH